MAIGRPWVLLLLALVPGLWAVARRSPPALSRYRRRWSLALRGTLVVLLVMALADARAVRRPARRALVVAVDLSDSARSSEPDARRAVEALLAAKGDDDLFGVVTFGREAEVESAPARRARFDGFQTRPEGGHTNVRTALDLADALIPSGYGRQIVLVSDGRQNVGDAAVAVAAMRRRGVRVDVVPLGPRPGDEVAVVALDAPAAARPGEALQVTARVRASTGTAGRIALEVDGARVESRDLRAPAGSSAHPFSVPPLPPGTHHLRVSVEARPDGWSQNNEHRAVVRVADRPAVLVLEGPAGAGANLAGALRAAGTSVEVRPAGEAPVGVGELTGYDAFVVADAAAAAFPPGALDALATAVRDLGRGLVATGGGRSYGPGGWGGTPLEEILPVRMDLPRPRDRPSAAVAVVIETMESDFADAVARSALGSVYGELGPDDEAAVVVMRPPATGGPYVAVPLVRAVDRAEAERRIGRAELGDPPGYAASMALGLEVLGASRAASKRLLLVADGDALADAGRYEPLYGAARAGGVVISAVGVDVHGDPAYLDAMRAVPPPGGLYHEAATPAELPEVLLAASRSALRPWIEQYRFRPVVSSRSDLLTGVPTDGLPEVDGYVAAVARPTADVVLATPTGDPLLATSGHGLGRTVAWTSDAAGQWTAALLGSAAGQALMGRMVAWALPGGEAAGAGTVAIDATPAADGLEVVVTAPGHSGEMLLRAVTPAGTTRPAALRPAGPDRWVGRVPAGEAGLYVLRATVPGSGAGAERTVAVPYPPEYLEPGTDEDLLRRLATEGGGILLAPPERAWSQPVRPAAVSSPVAWLLLLAVAVLWPADVALRRLAVRPRALVADLGRRRHRRGGRARPPAQEPHLPAAAGR